MRNFRIGKSDLGNWSKPIYGKVLSVASTAGSMSSVFFLSVLSADEIAGIYNMGKPNRECESLRYFIVFLFFANSAYSVEPSLRGETLFIDSLKPLFAEKCMACHGDEPEKIKE